MIAFFRHFDAVYQIRKSTREIVGSWAEPDAQEPRRPGRPLRVHLRRPARRPAARRRHHDHVRQPHQRLASHAARRPLQDQPAGGDRDSAAVDHRPRRLGLLLLRHGPAPRQRRLADRLGEGTSVGGYRPNGERTFRWNFDTRYSGRAPPVPAGAVSAKDLRQDQGDVLIGMRLTARSAAALVAAMVVGVVFSAGAKAAPGDLDPTFSGDGKQRTELRSGLSQATAMCFSRTARSSRSAPSASPAASRSPATTRTARSIELLRRRHEITDFGGSDDGARAVALQADGKIVAVGGGGDHTSCSPATTRTGRSTRASPGTASRSSTGGASTGRGGWRSRPTADRRGRTWRPPPSRLRTRPLQPQRVARHELLRGRQADDRLRGL